MSPSNKSQKHWNHLGIILFSYEFNENIHDRSINLDNGWKIILGRGLDIFSKNRRLV
ncbi:MAG: MIT C-terminal domain-containing protein [Saprospiraceae bacterium]